MVFEQSVKGHLDQACGVDPGAHSTYPGLGDQRVSSVGPDRVTHT